MNNLEALQRLVEKYHFDDINLEALVPQMITSPHANFAYVPTDDGADVAGGYIMFSFMEMGFCLLAAFESNDYFIEAELWKDIEPYKTIFSPASFPGSTEVVPGWHAYGEAIGTNIIASLYLYYGFCKGVQDPTQSEEFMRKATEIKEVYK